MSRVWKMFTNFAYPVAGRWQITTNMLKDHVVDRCCIALNVSRKRVNTEAGLLYTGNVHPSCSINIRHRVWASWGQATGGSYALCWLPSSRAIQLAYERHDQQTLTRLWQMQPMPFVIYRRLRPAILTSQSSQTIGSRFSMAA